MFSRPLSRFLGMPSSRLVLQSGFHRASSLNMAKIIANQVNQVPSKFRFCNFILVFFCQLLCRQIMTTDFPEWQDLKSRSLLFFLFYIFLFGAFDSVGKKKSSELRIWKNLGICIFLWLFWGLIPYFDYTVSFCESFQQTKKAESHEMSPVAIASPFFPASKIADFPSYYVFLFGRPPAVPLFSSTFPLFYFFLFFPPFSSIL